MARMTSKSITEAFLQMEDELDLFDQQIDSVYFWERIRFSLHQDILRSSGLIGQAHTRLERTSANRSKSALRCARNLVMKNPFRSQPAEILIWGCARRKLQEDGRWWDIYYDPLIDKLDETVTYVESPYLGLHYAPAKTANIQHMDIVQCLEMLKRRYHPVRIAFENREEKLLRGLQAKICDVFNAEFDVRERVKQDLLSRRYTLPLYRKLLERVRPRLVLIDNSYGKETFIEACRRINVPVIELQHGVLSQYHLGYSYVGAKRIKRMFPDFFFTFGDYWKKNIEYPIGKEQILSVGYPYLEIEREKYASVQKKDQVIFLSQGTIGSKMAEFAVQLSEKEDFSFTIVYKLHPGEYDRWRKEYPGLAEAKIQVVDDDRIPLYQLFAESKIQVGCNSTAIYEGLGFTLRTYLLDLPGVESMTGLIEMNYAKLVTSVNELCQRIEEDEQALESINIREFFRSNAVDNIRKGIDEALDAHGRTEERKR